jgi:fucose 4-O-acetylase-like acetyltransferase
MTDSMFPDRSVGAALAAAAVEPRRLAVLDAARGAAILLVVLGHTLRGLEVAGILPAEGVIAAVDRAIYAVHMPLFFLVSGLLAERLVLARPVPRLVLSRVERLLWPLALWTWIFFLFKLLAGGLSNSPVSLATFPLNPLPPQLHLWFLWALFLIQIALVPLIPLLRRIGDSGPVWLVLLAGSVVAGQTVELGPAQIPYLLEALRYAPLFLLGAVLARTGLPGGGRPAFGVALAVLAGALAVPAAGVTGGLSFLGVGAVASIAVLVALRDAPAGPVGHAVNAALARFGRASMAIFLMHTIFSAALRIALVSVGVEDPGLHLALGFAVGVALPMLALAAAQRLGLARILGI